MRVKKTQEQDTALDRTSMMIHGTWPFFICKDTCIPVEGSSVVTRCVLYPETDFYRRYMHHQKRFCPCVSSLFLWSVVCRRRMMDDYTINPRAIRLPNSIPDDDDDQIHISDSPTCHNIFLYIQSQIWELCTPAAFSSRPFQPADGQWEKEAKQNPRAQPSSSSAWHSLLFCSSTSWLKPQFVFIIRTLALSYFLSVRWKANTIFGRWWNVFTGRNIC